ncbi:MAG: hypothetical protein ACKV0T_24335 [Planctomycetales bacterium]
MTAPVGRRNWKGRCALLVLLAALAHPPSAVAQLKLEEVRPTYGRLGSTRPGTRVLPGEDLSVAYVVSGITRGSDGRVEVSRRAELIDEAGQTVAQVPVKTDRIHLALGGDTLTSHMHFGLPIDFAPGKYRVRGLLRDVRGEADIAAEQEFEVLPLDFGIVRLRLAADEEGTTPVGGNLTVNQDVYVVGRAIGFAHKGGRIHVVGQMTIRDPQGRPTLPAPIAFEVHQEVDEDVDQFNLRWSMMANRPGNFTIHIEVADEFSDKRAAYEMPLMVRPPPPREKSRTP